MKRPCEGVHRRTSHEFVFASSAVSCMPYSSFWGCFRDRRKVAEQLLFWVLVQLSSSYFSILFISFQVVHPYRRIDKTAAWKKLRFILSLDFRVIDNQSIAVYILIMCILMPLSVDKTLLPTWVNCPLISENLHFWVEIKTHVLRFVCIHICLLQTILQGFGLNKVYLHEALCHLHSLRP